jgi:hypothetical protein
MTLLDRRQLILEQLDMLLGAMSITLSTGLVPSANYVHNRNELPAGKVPGIILLDADEFRDPHALQPPPGRSLPPSMCLMRMTPEIYVVLDVRKGAQQNENVGEDLNAARIAILNTVINDTTLRRICGSNGQITYDSTVTDLARNRTMQGQMGISITFIYPFLPGELE